MQSLSGMRKYYIGLGVLLVVMVGFLVYTVSQAGAAKQDNLTNKAIEKMYPKLAFYGSDQAIPESLTQAGIKDVPSTIKYTKLSDTSYKICIDYKTAASGYDASLGALVGGAIMPQYNSFGGGYGNGSYFDTSVEYKHKKGQNCQTITPYNYNSGSSIYSPSLQNGSSDGNASTSACTDTGQAVFVGFLVVDSVDTAKKQVSFKPGDTLTNPSSSSAGEVTIKNYDSKTVFCDNASQKTTAGAVKAGQYVTVYAKSSTDPTIAFLFISQ